VERKGEPSLVQVRSSSPLCERDLKCRTGEREKGKFWNYCNPEIAESMKEHVKKGVV